MSKTIDYFFVPQSPWTYFGHARFVRMATEASATVRIKPMDLGKIFPLTGGLPVGQRSAQRQAYRLVELRRFADHLQMPLNLHPKFFPVAGDDAARLLIAVDQQDGVDAAMRLCGAVLSAVWAQERNIADPAVLAELLQEQHLDASRLAQAATAPVQTAYEQYTDQALALGVFGAPAYVFNGELFWGQDRLAFLEQRLQSS
ncbi:MAG: 2-hydroxychromene-2-carboxylate isomerase [Betaproteobacteria bacterium]|nr:2-hydroxychromene-2-carboxylate isomerase [Betaproteobacteria bacterium]